MKMTPNVLCVMYYTYFKLWNFTNSSDTFDGNGDINDEEDTAIADFSRLTLINYEQTE